MMSNIKCAYCGRYIAHVEMQEHGGARHYFTPDNHFGPEVSDWVCKVCEQEKDSVGQLARE